MADYLLVAGVFFAILVSVHNGRRLPIYAWAVLPPFVLLLIALVGSVVRGDPLRATRTPSQWREWVVGNAVGAEQGGALPLIARMAFSITAVAIIVASAAENSENAKVIVEKIIRFWAIGAAISATYGVVELNVFGKGSFLSHLPFLYHVVSDTRATGLANHPNSFGQTIANTLPMLIYLVGATRKYVKVGMVLALPISMYAIYLSGSRGALFCGAVIAVVTLAFLGVFAKRIHLWVPPMLAFSAALAIIFVPIILDSSRFFSKSGQISNAARIANLERGIDLLGTNPLFGAGVGSWNGEMVPLIVLTSGGVFYFIVFYTCLTRPLLVRPRSTRGVFVPILVISAIGVLGFGLLNNGIVERYLYWPFAALFALSLAHRSRIDADGVDDRSR
ncbi:O-antigen ligase family protein [Mycolicibacterium elephantis]|uniref:O-antigen ligase family protein n=1 Tax=Mycolicibacterium elephantis TaxID=81858 RepID=UPI000FE19739|nr:hypothetical protein [Mycolicibacterium elephantis]MCV7220895.1 hypothetical protein [Mycolicibacterium elephantis]